MPQIDDYIKLTPIFVNGKAVLQVSDRYVPAYLVRIWCRARSKDTLYWKGEPVDTFEVVDVSECNEFKLVRKGTGWNKSN